MLFLHKAPFDHCSYSLTYETDVPFLISGFLFRKKRHPFFKGQIALIEVQVNLTGALGAIRPDRGTDFRGNRFHKAMQ